MPISDTVFVALDLEMTGPRPESQEAIEIAAVRFRGDRVLATFSTLVRPTIPLPYNIQVLTGIRPEDLARAPAIEQVKSGLLAFMGRAPLVAHTVSADVGCLARHGIVLDNKQVDTHLLASVVLPQMPGYSLSILAAELGIDYPKQHRAAADAAVTRRLFLALIDRVRALDPGTVQEIVRLLEPHDWPLKWLFDEVRTEQSRRHTGAVSIRQALSGRAELGDLPLEVLMTAVPRREPIVPAVEPRAIDEGSLIAAAGDADAPLGTDDAAILRQVTSAMNSGGRLVVETPPSARDARAMALPAARHAVENGRQCVLAAASPEARRDLVAAVGASARLLGSDVRISLVRETTAYVCLRRWTELRHRAGLSRDESVSLAKTLVWLATTETGDGSELNLLEGERDVWPLIQAGHGACDRAACEFARRGVCYVERAIRQAEAAHVVVASHAALISASRHGEGLGQSAMVDLRGRHVILEEAHDLEDECTLRLSRADTHRSLADSLAGALCQSTGELAADLRDALASPAKRSHGGGSDPDLPDRIASALADAIAAHSALFESVGRFCLHASGDRAGGERRTRLTRQTRARPEWREAAERWSEARARLATLDELLARASAKLRAVAGGRSGAANRQPQERLRVARSAVASAIASLDEAMTSPRADWTYWLGIDDEAGDAAVHAAPITVGQTLASEVYDVAASVVLLSPTLTVAGSFDYTRARLGLDGFAESAAGAGSAESRGLLVLPRDIATPDQPLYQSQVRDIVYSASLAGRGRALALFSSNGQLRQTWQALAARFADRGILALGYRVDGSPRRYLLETFRTNPSSVLFSSGSLWEIPDLGPLPLPVVVLARLPFAPPSDPLASARAEAAGDPMADYNVPRAVLRVRQGILPALRSADGNYAVVMADRRVQTKEYGDLFLRSIPCAGQRLVGVRDVAQAVADWVGRA